MKDDLRRLTAETSDRWRARNLVREYLQARILQFIQESGLFRAWIFHGGTALRFLHGLPRFSEDLDFALAAAKTPPPPFSSVWPKAEAWFSAEAYRLEVKIDDSRTVHSAWLRFPGLLHEIGLSPHRTEILSVKVELDVHPSAAGATETTVVRRHVLLNLFHYGRATLWAGKLHAVLTRPYVKGRDIYDLFWYLAAPDWPEPDLGFLKAALVQTGWRGPEPTSANWTELVSQKLESIDWPKAVADAKPFVERIGDLEMMTREALKGLLSKRSRL
ncbi:MAG: nucleotidyl transferase AbiEii/AbiGii toxin family protein [Candidatus Aminicenantes bacterium]|nr:nucleotidyl transferase AbiEii/AbiGii toxin family protein [Candidatus Aminicenantes bacterium]